MRRNSGCGCRILAGAAAVLFTVAVCTSGVRAEEAAETVSAAEQEENIVETENTDGTDNMETPEVLTDGAENGQEHSASDKKEDDYSEGYFMMDNTTGIEVETGSFVIPEGMLLYVTSLNQGDVYEMLMQLLTVRAQKFTAYDIRFINPVEGNEFRPDGIIQYSIPVPEGYDIEQLAVWRMDVSAGAEREAMDISIKDGRVRFESEYTGVYIVAETKTINLPESLELTEKVEKVEVSAGNNLLSAQKEKGSGIPRTGDETQMGGWVAALVMAAAAAVIVFVIRKKK